MRLGDRLYTFLACALLGITGARGQSTAQSPLTPEQALTFFEVADDLAIDLVAAEPLVVSPCAMAFDERGRLYVAENTGYPRNATPAQGTIALLEDIDGDGRMDRRTVFAANLSFPNGVMPWRGGLFVTCAPDLLYFKDTDGDGRADQRRVVLTGFETKGSTQLRVNAPMLGPDGWIYLASGLSGGRITNPDHPEFNALEMKSDLRFDPRTERFELTDGRSQYGQSFDDFGRRFICMNRIQVQHVVLPSRYLRRNPHLAFSDTVQNCPELLPNPLLAGGGGAARIYPISQNITTADSHAGTFSAACGIHLWRGGALPVEYVGCAFSCDPTGNLVHVDKLEARGATFAARPMFDGREFLASRDDWFRPVFLATGPDGALYVCDMYRKVIEHPDYLPEEINKRTDFEAGKEMGRIWRVRAQEARPSAPAVDQRGLAPRALMENLTADNGWLRDLSFRLLVEQASPEWLPLVQTVFEGHQDNAGGAMLLRLAAILSEHEIVEEAPLSAPVSLLEPPIAFAGTLRQMGSAAYRSKSPEVRATALAVVPIKVQSAYLRDSSHKVRALDPHPFVRFQFALNADLSIAEDAKSALFAIANSSIEDRWTRAAVLTRAELDLRSLVFLAGAHERLLAGTQESLTEAHFDFFFDAARTAAAKARANSGAFDHRFTLDSLAEKAGFDLAAAFIAGYAEDAALQLKAPEGLARLITQAVTIAIDPKAPAPRRIRAVKLLVHGRWDTVNASLLESALASDLSVSIAAIRALSRFDDPAVAPALLNGEYWSSCSPAQRDAILASLVSKPLHLRGILDALESGSLPASAVDSARRQQLVKHRDAEIRERAAKIFVSAPAGDRLKAFETAKAALALKPEPANGREVFKRACASCHRLDRDGFAVGPDLFGIRNQPKESILLHIVVPDHEIAPGFAAYSVETKDDRSLSGIVISETADAISLRQAGGADEKLLRSNIAQLAASSLSLMPAGLEAGMTSQDLADLVAYLKGE